ncbi:MAG: helix-turn-helix domain-containing protein, partial [Elusimicrobia bacterium]|nr:helix-turn-helix domain-containing protein [Elusimicrobiota bacterium]
MMIQNEPDPLRRIPTKHVAGIRAEIGSVLLAARKKKGLSQEAVAQQTRIPKRYLDAFENDRFDDFPALVYLRGFLKSYCDFLEVPFDELWARIEAPAAADASDGGGGG